MDSIDIPFGNEWSIFIDAQIQNRVVWSMDYLIKNSGEYYIEHTYSLYGGYAFGPDSAHRVHKVDINDDKVPEMIKQIIEADMNGEIDKYVTENALLKYKWPICDFGGLDTISLPKELIVQLKKMKETDIVR
ncbi:MAG: hypothetical protein E7473_11465 [Ruminococcaceae bacterium]|nr:hypothetical protein [Oscillospiraceae bacterium]